MESVFPDTLNAKLLMPRVGPRLVHRDRLTVRLDAGMNGDLTLVTAPAGYGKTTLLVDWLRSRTSEVPRPPAVAWLSLDAADNDPVQFSRSLVAAVRFSVPEIGDALAAMTQHPQLPSLRTVVAVLSNALGTIQRDIILVLEDYHVIRSTTIHEAVVFLLEHLPALLHLVVLTREDPPFPLARLRARGALCELRAADLQFTTDEATRFLREMMELPVSADEAAALEARTEGWVAGLQLAALSVRTREDISAFIAAFGGNNRYILEYLGQEVLARQPSPVQTFLLRTSVLDRLSGPLCEAVLEGERPDGEVHAMLDHIERSNLFLIPLDEQRRWYRYHHLFADFLRAHLSRINPGLASELHRRASTWYETNGLIHDAIHHALAAPDPDHAARLIEEHGWTVNYLGQQQTLFDWFQRLPTEVVQLRPRLCIIHAYALGVTNRSDAAERYLQAAEQHLRSDDHREDAGLLRGRIAYLRAVMTGIRGDLARSVAFATQAADLLPASAVAEQLPARVYAHRVMGDAGPASEHALAMLVEQAKAAGLQLMVRVSLSRLARLHVLQGRLHRAAAVFAEAERTLGPHVFTGLPGCCFGLGDVLREWSDLVGADRLLTQGMASITEANMVEAYTAALGYVALARLRQARGDSHGAMTALDEFVGLARQREFTPPVVARVAAVRAHLWLLQGNLVAATRWADTSGLGPDDAVSFLRELEYLVLARVLIARKSRGAPPLLERVLRDAETQGRMGSAIEILTLRALAAQTLGDPAGALSNLARALSLGEPEGYVRVFVDEGAPMAALLRRARARGIAPEYAGTLLGAFGDRTTNTGSSGSTARGATVSPSDVLGSSLLPVEPLTRREREILRLMVEGASNQEVARKLFITPGTVKKHVYHIFGKLGVRNRTQTVAKAKALNLD